MRGLLRTTVGAGALIGLLALATLLTSAPASRSHRTQPSTQRGLLSLPAAAQAPVSAALGRDEPGYRVRGAATGFVASNPLQHLSTRFTAGGVSIADAGARLALRLNGYGSTTAPHLVDGRVTYQHGPLAEWYANGPLGLEQGFTLDRPTPAASANLTLAVGVGGNMAAQLSRGDVLLRHGATTLRYTGLRASDARGRPLAASLGLDPSSHRILIHVDARGASYPIRIDPLVEEAELTSSKTGDGPLGNAVAIDGNTAVVGATESAYVFVEPPGGWSDITQTAQLTATTGGQRFYETAHDSSLKPIGKLTGIGAARQASEYVITIPDVDPTVPIQVALDGSNLGKLGSQSRIDSVRKLVKSISEPALLRSLTK
jgi:hypothetical protein